MLAARSPRASAHGLAEGALSGASGRAGSPSPVADFRLRQWPTGGVADGEFAK
jgi:hypothetical protein